VDFTGPVTWVLDRFSDRRRVRVGVHLAYFRQGEVPHYFIKVSNLSRRRDIEITHVWVEGAPPVNVMLPERPLPTRLKPDEMWEGWVRERDVAHIPNVDRAVRARLGNRKVVRSRPDRDLPDEGFTGGKGSPEPR